MAARPPSKPSRPAAPSKKAAPSMQKAPPTKSAPAKSVRHVVPDKDAGGWKVKAPKKTAPTAAAPTQAKAEIAAKKQVTKLGGGQVVIHDRKGKIRDADTVAPGGESKKKDTKH